MTFFVFAFDDSWPKSKKTRSSKENTQQINYACIKKTESTIYYDMWRHEKNILKVGQSLKA